MKCSGVKSMNIKYRYLKNVVCSKKKYFTTVHLCFVHYSPVKKD